jgi:hypothetical protein
MARKHKHTISSKVSNKINIVIHNKDNHTKKRKRNKRKSKLATLGNPVQLPAQPIYNSGASGPAPNTEATSYTNKYLLNDEERIDHDIRHLLKDKQEQNELHQKVASRLSAITDTNDEPPQPKTTNKKAKRNDTIVYTEEGLSRIRSVKGLKAAMKLGMPTIKDETLKQLNKENKRDAIKAYLNKFNNNEPPTTKADLHNANENSPPTTDQIIQPEEIKTKKIKSKKKSSVVADSMPIDEMPSNIQEAKQWAMNLRSRTKPSS